MPRKLKYRCESKFLPKVFTFFIIHAHHEFLQCPLSMAMPLQGKAKPALTKIPRHIDVLKN
jgi:hypothetical protein